MENDYSKLDISDLTLLLFVTIGELARISRRPTSYFTYQAGIAREQLLNDMCSIRMEIRKRVGAVEERKILYKEIAVAKAIVPAHVSVKQN